MKKKFLLFLNSFMKTIPHEVFNAKAKLVYFSLTYSKNKVRKKTAGERKKKEMKMNVLKTFNHIFLATIPRLLSLFQRRKKSL